MRGETIVSQSGYQSPPGDQKKTAQEHAEHCGVPDDKEIVYPLQQWLKPYRKAGNRYRPSQTHRPGTQTHFPGGQKPRGRHATINEQVNDEKHPDDYCHHHSQSLEI